jgi:uncharacterized protein
VTATRSAQPSATVSVRVQPKASTNRITVDERGIRVAVTAPPADGAANKAVCACLADGLGITKSRVSIRTGHQSRDKIIQIVGLAVPDLLERLAGAKQAAS